MILPISGLTETGQNGSGVLGSPMTCLTLRNEKAAQLRYVLTPRESKGVAKAMQPGLGRKVSLLLCLVYW